ncbi:hypothetical protein GGX14DRAFT_578736 [Mycena pura]|uniref:Uncharacterized protein n=1 Tax=Mycena pura TaxID=153505 RepID=A0AAD6XXK8_9AGAR|nr:hypothetical protein GGX14DRAFT_578736 [Mycena pura]
MVRLLRFGLAARERCAPAVRYAPAGSHSRRWVPRRAPRRVRRAPPLLAAAGLHPASWAQLSVAARPIGPRLLAVTNCRRCPCRPIAAMQPSLTKWEVGF